MGEFFQAAMVVTRQTQARQYVGRVGKYRELAHRSRFALDYASVLFGKGVSFFGKGVSFFGT